MTVAVLTASALVGAAAFATPVKAATTTSSVCGPSWVQAWHATPVKYTARLLGDLPMFPRPDDSEVRPLTGHTLRMIIRPEASGSALRIHLTNRYGNDALRIGAVTIAAQDQGAAVIRDTMRPVLFARHARVSVPAGGSVYSDSIRMNTIANAPLAVSVYLLDAPDPVTRHVDTLTTSYVSGEANYANTDAAWPFVTPTPSAFYLDGVDVWTPARMNAVMAVGDSITDGTGVTADAQARWTDALQRRINQEPPDRQMVVLNAGVGGSRLLTDTVYRLGESALSRLRWDIASPAGVTDVILFVGTNDIGIRKPMRDSKSVIAGYKRFVTQAHAMGLRVYVATIAPTTMPYYSTKRAAQTRDTVNKWIRDFGDTVFDGMFDFAAAVANPARPAALSKLADAGDRLHLNAAGQQELADAVNLDALTGSPCLGEQSPTD